MGCIYLGGSYALLWSVKGFHLRSIGAWASALLLERSLSGAVSLAVSLSTLLVSLSTLLVGPSVRAGCAESDCLNRARACNQDSWRLGIYKVVTCAFPTWE